MVADLPTVAAASAARDAPALRDMGAQASVGTNMVVSMAAVYVCAYTLASWGWAGQTAPHVVGGIAAFAILVVETLIFIRSQSTVKEPT